MNQHLRRAFFLIIPTLLLLMANPVYAALPPNYDFSSSMHGWTSVDLSGPSFYNGGANFNISGADPYIYSPTFTGFSASVYRKLHLEMASTAGSCAQLYFRRSTDSGYNENRSVTFDVYPNGSDYTYVVDMTQSAYWSGDIVQVRLDVTCSYDVGRSVRVNSLTFRLAGPENDDFDSAVYFFGEGPHSDEAFMLYGSVAEEDPTPSCGIRGNFTVWYKHHPSSFGYYRVQTYGSSYDTTVSVWTGTRGNLNEVACDDDSGPGSTSDLRYIGSSAGDYYIMVGGNISTGALDFHLEFEEFAAPSSLDLTQTSSSSIRLEWNDNSDFEDRYYIYRSINGGSWSQITYVGADTESYYNTGRSCGVEYAYRVRGWNSDVGYSSYSNTDRYTIPCALTAPTEFTVTANSDSQVYLQWNDTNADESGYRIWRSVNGSSYDLLSTRPSNSTNYYDNTVSCGNTYRYEVEAYRTSDGDYAFSATRGVTMAECPLNAPGNVSAEAVSDSQVNLMWQDTNSTESGYQVQRSPNNTDWTAIITFGEDTTSHTDTGLPCGTTWYYRIMAYRVSDSSMVLSSVVEATTGACVLAAPTDLSMSVIAPDQVDLSWDHDGVNVTAFHMERSIDNVNWVEIGSMNWPNVTYSDTTLTCGTDVFYRVRAYDDGNGVYSPYGNVVSDTVYCELLTPELFAVPTAQNTITAYWTESGSATLYVLERSLDGINWTVFDPIAAPALSYIDTDLICNIQVSYRIRSYRAGDAQYSDYSTVTSLLSLGCPVSAPTSLAATPVSETAVSLSWADTATDESNYYIEWSLDGGNIWYQRATLPANSTTHVDNGLTCGRTYHYRLRAFRNSDYFFSEYSNVASATTPNCQLNAPAGLSVDYVTETGLWLLWADQSQNESFFLIERSLDGTSWHQVGTTRANYPYYQFSHLRCETEYWFRVQAYRQSDDIVSGYSNVVTAMTLACPVDETPGLVNIDDWTVEVGASAIISIPADCSGTELGCDAWDIALEFDPTIIRIDGVSLGSLPGSTGNTILPFINTFSNDDGQIETVWATHDDGYAPTTGSGSLLILDVTALSLGTTDITFARSETASMYGELNAVTNTAGTVSVVPPPTPPVASADAYTAFSSVALVIDADEGVLSNDTDVNLDLLTVTSFTQPTYGTVSVEDNGAFTYTSDVGYVGEDTFTYVANDGALSSELAIVTIEVINVAPVAEEDTYSTDHATMLTIDAAVGVLVNDADINLDALTIVDNSEPVNGTLVLAADGSFTYEPNREFKGEDTFTYTVSDGLATDAAIVTINVGNAIPVTMADNYDVTFETPLVITAPQGLLSNDSDVNSMDTLNVMSNTQPDNGTVTVEADGGFTYEPLDGFSGEDAFTYTITDGEDTSESGSVILTVSNGIPLTADDQYQTAHATMLTLDTENGVLANDDDPNGEVITVASNTEPQYGELSIQTDGSFSYTPEIGYKGDDSFTYVVTDGHDESISGLVTITVLNAPPVTQTDTYETAHNTILAIDVASGILANDTDPNTDTLTIASHTGPNDGMLTLNSDGSFVYTPNYGFRGEDRFIYVVTDGEEEVESTPVTITVANAAPVVVDDMYEIAYATPLTVAAAQGVLANDVDPNGDVLAFDTITDPSNGSLTLNPDGSFLYTPNNGFSGDDAFTYSVTDGLAASGVATVTINVGPDNIAPVAADDTYTITIGQTLHIDAPGVLVNDSDADAGDTLTANLLTSPSQGTLTLNTDGSFTYTPDFSAVGTDTFTYNVNDGTIASNAATATITLESPAGVPTRLYPSDGTIITDTMSWPRFQFRHYPDVEWYGMWIGTWDHSRTVINEWYAASSICVDGLCTLPDDLWLTNDGYLWWMTYWSPTLPDYANRWNPTEFTVLMMMPVPLNDRAPEGEVASFSGLTWQHDPGTLWYQLWLGTADYTETVLFNWYSATNICADGICSLPVYDTLSPGQYEWWVETWGPGGYQQWGFNGASTFTILPANPPDTP